MIPTVLGVVIITFILFNVVPGDLAATILGKNSNAQQRADFDREHGLDKPLFVGYHAETRAYEDLDLSKGIGLWNKWENVRYSDDVHALQILAGDAISPFALSLGDATEYEWKITYRGEGAIAGTLLSSSSWKTEKIRFSGASGGALAAGEQPLEIKKIQLRRIVENPFDSQLVFFVSKLAKGDLGRSETYKRDVKDMLREGIPVSLRLTIPIFIIGLVVSLVMSLICAFYRNTWIDRSLVVISVALMSINYLVYIVVGQYLLAYKKMLFPVWGYESLSYLVLPVIVGVFSGLGSSVRFYRTIMLDEMYKDYVRTAFAKGVSKSRVLFVHVLKNAMIPVITNVVIAIPFLYTGSMILESYFGIPGLGYLGFNAINAGDVDVVRAIVLIGALLYVVANLLTDICYAWADPRVKLK